MVSCDHETLSSRSDWCRSQPSSKVTQGLLGVTWCFFKAGGITKATELFGRSWMKTTYMDSHVVQWIFDVDLNDFLDIPVSDQG